MNDWLIPLATFGAGAAIVLGCFALFWAVSKWVLYRDRKWNERQKEGYRIEALGARVNLLSEEKTLLKLGLRDAEKRIKKLEERWEQPKGDLQ